jgi:hypothetical protein
VLFCDPVLLFWLCSGLTLFWPLFWPPPGELSEGMIACVQAIAAKYKSLPVNDKYKHCMVAGEAYERCGVTAAYLASFGKEIMDLFGPGNPEWEDLRADFDGINCAASNYSCGNRCIRSLDECCKCKGRNP